MNIKNLKFIIDVIGKVRYIEYESDEIEKVAQLQFSGSRKKDKAEMLGNDIRPTGAKLE